MSLTYRERRYFCGDYLEVDLFPVFPVAKSRNKKRKPTSKVQQRLNQHNAEQKLIRLLHTNFTSEDLEIHLTYNDDNHPESEEEAAKDIQNFLRRVKRLRKKRGLPELKYICVTEGGEGKRFHFHITVNAGLTRDELEALWGYGYANARRLQFTKHGVEGLARYITKQNRKKKNDTVAYKKRWTSSKNLTTPQPKDRDGKISHRRAQELARDFEDAALFEKLYPGYAFASCRPFHNEVNGGYYLCLNMYRKDSKFNNTKTKRKDELSERMTV